MIVCVQQLFNSINLFQKRQHVRDNLLKEFSELPSPADGLSLAFRLPDSTKLQYCFDRDDSLMVSV